MFRGETAGNGALRIMTEEVNHRIPLENGICLDIRESARRYFGDYHSVKIEIECLVPLERRFFDDNESFLQASASIRRPVRFARSLQRTGVPTSEISRVKEELLSNFRRNALPYVSSPVFPRKLIENEARSKR
jgi:hypothetical protein